MPASVPRKEDADSYVLMDIIMGDRGRAERDLMEFASRIGVHAFEKRSYLEMLLEKRGSMNHPSPKPPGIGFFRFFLENTKKFDSIHF